MHYSRWPPGKLIHPFPCGDFLTPTMTFDDTGCLASMPTPTCTAAATILCSALLFCDRSRSVDAGFSGASGEKSNSSSDLN